MKGQFFLIGAVLICMLLYAASVPLITVQGRPPEDMGALSDNMEAEMPHALNIGINSSSPAGTLISFCNFSRSAASSRGIDLSAVFVVFESTGSGTVATAGNAAADDATVGLDVDGTHVELTVPAGSVSSAQFPAAGEHFDVTVETDAGTYGATLPANKTSMYCALSLSRGGTVIGKEILA
jgi:hypothetical protein